MVIIIIFFFFHDILQFLGSIINVFDAHLQEATFTKLWNTNNTNSCYFKALTDCKFYFILFYLASSRLTNEGQGGHNSLLITVDPKINAK